MALKKNHPVFLTSKKHRKNLSISLQYLSSMCLSYLQLALDGNSRYVPPMWCSRVPLNCQTYFHFLWEMLSFTGNNLVCSTNTQLLVIINHQNMIRIFYKYSSMHQWISKAFIFYWIFFYKSKKFSLLSMFIQWMRNNHFKRN